MSIDNDTPAHDSGLVDTLAKAGIPTVVIDYRQQWLETTVPSTLLLGRLFGREERAGGVDIGAQRIPGHTGVLSPEFVLTTDVDFFLATGANGPTRGRSRIRM